MTLNKIIAYFNLFSTASVLAPFIVGLIKFKILSTPGRILFFYSLLACITECFSIYLGYKYINNIFLAHIFVVIEWFCFSFIYIYLFDIKNKKRALLFALAFILFISSIDAFYINGLKRINTFSHNMECLSLILIAILFFHRTIVSTSIPNILSSFSFWFNSATLFYCSGVFFIFLFGNYLIKLDADSFGALFTIHSAFNILFNSILALSLTRKYNGR